MFPLSELLGCGVGVVGWEGCHLYEYNGELCLCSLRGLWKYCTRLMEPPLTGSIVATDVSLKIVTASVVGFSNYMGTPTGEGMTRALAMRTGRHLNAACSRLG